MCGITGWISFDRDLTREQETLEAMTQTMACRGPDASGTWVDGPAALGHRRLAVIDIAGGAQPMSVRTAAGEVALVYSGEAYNFLELREELRRAGERFETSSDTEVVLRGYLRWGEALADRLNGMYAFAIWDSRKRKLVLIRDRLGIKPLYIFSTRDGVLFGSEPKAILANPLARHVVDGDGLRELFAFVKSPRHAMWSGMREVEPGTIVTVDVEGIRERTYWRLQTMSHTDCRHETVAHVRELLDDIVSRQLIADVPRCVLLSGGLDSSAITALSAAKLAEQGEQVRTFAVDFVGQTEHFKPDDLRSTPDGPYVHDVAGHVGSQHTDIVLDYKTLADPAARRAVVTARDMPMGLGEMDASLYLLCKAIREHSTVALSGESADEIFGGYRQFHDPVAQRAHTFPWLVANLVPFGDADSMLNDDVRSALDLSGYRRDRYESAIAEVSHLDSETDLEYRMRISSYLHLTRFLRLLLDRKDRMSMAVGLEVRVPFCDHRLVEYVYNAPWALKTYDGREKSLLRGAVYDLLPESVAQRVKSPYPSTQDPQYVGAIQGQAKSLLGNRGHDVFSLVDPHWLAEAVRQDPATISPAARHGLERTLDVAAWLDIYRPQIVMPAGAASATARRPKAA
ncbi:MAG TPA: asparagine synthase (glutamine-hydrolyzing) [Solirubrobacteraceae bacterium]|jgi:asparagine synthase (glutamine-hydrolysing)|nr:asparagine synthase (glutamine-hydrolyzing) [Solirubrobacteraceae bacterium]